MDSRFDFLTPGVPHRIQDMEEPIDSEMTRAVESLKYFMVNNQMEKDQEEW